MKDENSFEYLQAAKDTSHLELDEKTEGNSLSALQYMEARSRWGAMGLSAILRCAETKNVGMRKFLELADNTQRELVGRVAKEYYATELGLVEDELKTFEAVTAIGITGCGFEYEIDAGITDDKYIAVQYKCPIVDNAHRAGYENGDSAFRDLGLWCDTYDNFESNAVAPSQIMVHSHCLGRNDTNCKLFMQSAPEGLERKPGEHLYDYTARMRDKWREDYPDTASFTEGKSPAELEEGSAELRKLTAIEQDKVAPSLVDKKKMGAQIWGRIGAVSTLMAGKLLGWDRFVESMKEKQGPCLTRAAREKADDLGIEGNTVHDAVALHQSLINGQEFGAYDVNAISKNRIEGTCTKCPIVEYGQAANLAEAAESVINWCSAARTYEAQAIDKNIKHTYTHCMGKGHKICRWVIEKQE